MPKALFNGVVIAESGDCVVVEGNQYFPRDAVNEALLRPSDKTTFCPWKGTARYYDVVVGDSVAAAGAWYYPEPKEAAANIADHLAFWNGVRVEV